MLYEKPELITLSRALEAICHNDKDSQASDNNGGTKLATSNAYEADE